MKKFLSILLSAVFVLALAGCRRATDNGKIDGNWQIREIQYTDGSTVYPENCMIAIQLELLQLQQNRTLTGVLDYHKNDTRLGVDFRYKPTDAQLYPYGFVGDPQLSGPTNTYCVLTIESVNSKHLVLKSPIATITCRRY